MAIERLTKDEIFAAISEGTEKAMLQAFYRLDAPGMWTSQMKDAISSGAYRAVYEAETKRIFDRGQD